MLTRNRTTTSGPSSRDAFRRCWEQCCWAGDPLLINLHRFVLFPLAMSLGWDLTRAAVLAAGIAIFGRMVLAALRRTPRHASFLPSDPIDGDSVG